MPTASEQRKYLVADPSRLAKTEIFRDLAPEVTRQIVEQSQVRSLEPGEALFRLGDPYRGQLFIVYQGAIEQRRPDYEAYIADPGEILGLASYLDGAPYGSTAVAREDVVVLALPASVFRELEERYPPFFNLINRIVAERIRRHSAAQAPVSGALAQPVGQVMKSPLSSCGPEVSLREAVRIMQERKIGSLAVKDEVGRLVGVLTFAGLAEAALLGGVSPDDSVMQGACEMPQTIAIEAPLWEAEERFQRERLKYLIVVEDGEPVGVLSQTDIVKNRLAHQPALLARVGAAGSIEELKSLFQRLPELGREARETNRWPSYAVRQLSEGHLAIQRRCLVLALSQMEREGHGPAPVPYALLVMGSGGRREMMLNPDQDNGIILADEAQEAGPAALQWFERFCDVLNTYLDRVGYPLCPGNIMARNPMFRKTLSGWKEQITYMTAHPNQKAARWSNIVFDFETLYGDDRLTGVLRKHVHTELQVRPKLLEFMVKDDAEGRPPLGLFNRLISAGDNEHKGRIDIKRNGLRIIADAARIFALSAGVSSCNTSERLVALMRLGILSAELADSARAAYEELLDLLLDHQLDQWGASREPDRLIDPERLVPRQRESLREAMRAVKRFQELLQAQFSP